MFDVYVLIFHVWWLFLDITKAVEEAQEKHEQRKKKEEGFRKYEERIEKEQEVYQPMFMSAQEQMDKAIKNNNMVSVKAAREILNAATKMLDAVKNHKNEQAKIRIDIGAAAVWKTFWDCGN